MAASWAPAAPLRRDMALPRSSFGPFWLRRPGRPGQSHFRPCHGCLLNLRFQAGLLSIPKGRAQECFALAPEPAALLQAMPAFEGFEGPFSAVLCAWAEPLYTPSLACPLSQSFRPGLLCFSKSRAQERFTLASETASLLHAKPT